MKGNNNNATQLNCIARRFSTCHLLNFESGKSMLLSFRRAHPHMMLVGLVDVGRDLM